VKITKYRLTDICDFQGGSQPPKSVWVTNKKKGYTRMLQIRDFTQKEKDYVGYVPDSKTLKKCKKDDVLIGRYGASVGKILTGLEGAYNVAIMKTIPNQKILLKDYLYTLLRGPIFQNFILSVGSRAAQAGFNKEDLSKFELFLPSLSNQKRIAKVLSDCEQLISWRRESIQLVNDFLESTFLKKFGDSYSNPKNYSTKEIQNLTLNIVDCPHSTPKYIDHITEFPCIRTSEIKNGIFDWTSMKYTNKAGYDQRIRRLKPMPNDVVFAREGTVGDAALIPKGINLSLGQRVMLFRVDKTKMLPEFFWLQLRSKGIQHVIKTKTIGATVTRINMSEVKRIKFIVPQIEEQMSFVNFSLKITEIKYKLNKSLSELKNLYLSMSQKALKGDLDLGMVELKESEVIIVENQKTVLGKSNFTDSRKPLKRNDLGGKKSNEKKNISNMTLLDFLEIPSEHYQHKIANDYGPELDFIDDDLFYQFYLKDNFNTESFTFSDLQNEFNKYYIIKGKDFDSVKWKEMIFKYLEVKKPLLEQIFEEETGTIKLKLTDEAFKA